MHNEQRIVELLAETLIKFDSMIDEQRQTNKRLEKLEDGVAKLNVQTVENTRAIFKLANEFENVLKLSERVTKLENTVYK
jgi:predicted RNase H-like nuclease (RuvC/YqgF family)